MERQDILIVRDAQPAPLSKKWFNKKASDGPSMRHAIGIYRDGARAKVGRVGVRWTTTVGWRHATEAIGGKEGGATTAGKGRRDNLSGGGKRLRRQRSSRTEP